MPRYIAAALPAGCPWSGWAPPNIDWCEAELCAVVVNPAGTWSNLAYIAFGLWMIAAARREANPALALFGPASIFVGITSMLYHASYTAFFQFFDFVGMFIFCMTIIAVNAVRLGWTAATSAWKLGVAGVVGLALAMPLVSRTPVPIQAMVLVLILVILGQEAIARMRSVDDARPGEAAASPRDRTSTGPASPRPIDRRGLWAAVGLLGLAAAFSASDVTRVACDPNDHLVQGHAIWHLLSAASLVALFLYQRHLGRRAFAMGRVA